MKNASLLILISLFLNTLLLAQSAKEKLSSNPPVIFEALAGGGGFASQLIINKGFEQIPRLGFFSVTNISSKWNEHISLDAMNQANLTFEVIKSLRILGGVHYTPVTGLRPTAALMYTIITNSVIISAGPRIDLCNNSNIEGFGMSEYTPRINDKWKIYSRIQGIYSETINTGAHARSYLMARAGASYLDFSFGVGANWDVFGPDKLTKQNYGLFLAARLFN